MKPLKNHLYHLLKLVKKLKNLVSKQKKITEVEESNQFEDNYNSLRKREKMTEKEVCFNRGKECKKLKKNNCFEVLLMRKG